ncbi:MAG: D-Ala-D-Ala carboxypeptidase family metallohydrolase, partial [Gemmatimonadota bacterium]
MTRRTRHRLLHPHSYLALPLLAAPVFLALGAAGWSSPNPDEEASPGATAASLPLATPDPFAELPLDLVREAPTAPPGAIPLPGVRPHPYSYEVRASFSVRVRDVVIPYRVLGITARPGERIGIELDRLPDGASAEAFRLRTPTGIQEPSALGSWEWAAPAGPGPVPLRLESLDDGDAIVLNVLVVHPFEEAAGGSMNGFRIGEYRISSNGVLPNGFIEANEDVLDLRMAPGFILRQFLPHQPGDPRYLALSEPLLLKLEAILEEVRVEGIEARTLHVMSAFRTPHYNRAIGNTTDASRHLWGDAADIFIDEVGNGWMDDLTGDGQGGNADARLLHRIIERVEARAEPHVRPGGLHIYPPNPTRGPFLHVDARGVPARW